jgi:hypothetical protein
MCSMLLRRMGDRDYNGSLNARYIRMNGEKDGKTVGWFLRGGV